jgi:hypothetical protein
VKEKGVNGIKGRGGGKKGREEGRGKKEWKGEGRKRK